MLRYPVHHSSHVHLLAEAGELAETHAPRALVHAVSVDGDVAAKVAAADVLVVCDAEAHSGGVGSADVVVG